MSIRDFFQSGADAVSDIQDTVMGGVPAQDNSLVRSLRSTAPLSLGNVDFDKWNSPESVNMGVRQQLAIHRMIGGRRVVDAMGSDYDSVSWEGMFFNEDAVTKADLCEQMVKNAEKQVLMWGRYNFDVIVESFQADYRRGTWIDYRISCVILQARDIAPPVQSPLQEGRSALNAVDTSGATGALQGVMKSVSGARTILNNARSTATQIRGTLSALQNAQATVRLAVNDFNETIDDLGNLGSALTTSQLIRDLDTVTGAMDGLSNLGSTQARITRAITGIRGGS